MIFPLTIRTTQSWKIGVLRNGEPQSPKNLVRGIFLYLTSLFLLLFYFNFLIGDLLICFSIFKTSIQTDLSVHVLVDSILSLTQRAFLISIFNTNIFIVVYIFL